MQKDSEFIKFSQMLTKMLFTMEGDLNNSNLNKRITPNKPGA